ncbi:tricarboxylate transporter [uncultured Paracoccus sp.]|uniref:Bug family tripartite tricarboxylate transporter substrate binding protein n=1 Tax=uncultured Paracoccus sp. TaxID=189685 RepID=UPI002637D42B|nr:tricarboxylate transporter [uncultured Paracoccus sp.]
MIRHTGWGTCSVAAAVVAGLFGTPAQADFSGQTIEVIVPFAPGGATDVAARFLEKYFERHLEGNPNVEVINREGGGSILGAKWFEANAEPDGLRLLFTTSSTANPYVLGQPEVEYDLAAYRVAYGLPFGSVTYVSAATGIKTVEDFVKADGLIYGGIGAAASDLPTLLSFELFDVDVNSALGFTGRGPIRLSFERGETNVDFQFTPVYLTQVADTVAAGDAVALMSGGYMAADGNMTERDPAVPDLPSVHEAYTDLHGEAPSGVEWDAYNAMAALTLAFGLTAYLHPDTPDDIITLYADAVERINADPEFQEEAKDVVGGYPLTLPAYAEGPLRAALQPSDEVREYLIKLLSEKYDVQF